MEGKLTCRKSFFQKENFRCAVQKIFLREILNLKPKSAEEHRVLQCRQSTMALHADCQEQVLL